MDASSACQSPRRGFTLVEILVVIVIIGLLAGLLTPALIAVMKNANVTAIKIEVTNLAMAVEQYKTKYSDYPPDFFGLQDANVVDDARARVLRHFRKAFPRYVPGAARGDTSGDAWDRFRLDVGDFPVANGTITVDSLTPASALVFCLGGIPDPETKQLMGFSANPKDPFERGEDVDRNGFDPSEDTNGNGILDWGARTQKLFDFKETQLRGYDKDDDAWTNWPTYSSSKTEVPYVYFRPRRCAASERLEYAYEDGNELRSLYYEYTGDTASVCVPYLAEVADPDDPTAVGEPSDPGHTRRWNSPDSFQIISPGADEEFGNDHAAEFRLSTTGKILCDNAEHELFTADLDNVANFSEGALENEVETE